MSPLIASALVTASPPLSTVPVEQILIERPVPAGHVPRRCDATVVRSAVLADEAAAATWKTAAQDGASPAALRTDVDAVLTSLRCTTLSAAAPMDDLWPLFYLATAGVGLAEIELRQDRPLQAARLALDLIALGQDLQYGSLVEKSVGTAWQLQALGVVEEALSRLPPDGRAEVADRALSLADRRAPVDLRVDAIWYRTWTQGSWDPRLWWAMRDVDAAIDVVNAASPGSTPDELTSIVQDLRAEQTSSWFPLHLSLGLLSVLEDHLESSTEANVRIAELALSAQSSRVGRVDSSACFAAPLRIPIDPRTLSELAGAAGTCTPVGAPR